MQKTVAIVGAGGKMGARAAEKIGRHPQYSVLMVETQAEKSQALAASGFHVTPFEDAVVLADFIVLAVPDAAIGKISHAAVPRMKPGAALIAHPCHPPFFTEQATAEARRDYFGGLAVQDIIVALVEGPEETFAEGTELCRAIFAPVNQAHRVTAEQFAFLEPAMSEMVVATAAALMKASLDEAIHRGVPPAAAQAFMAGHAQIAMAICFGAEKSPFSDAAKLAIQWGLREIIRPDWRRVFERETLSSAIHEMLHPPGA
jgi:hypothetical protein